MLIQGRLRVPAVMPHEAEISHISLAQLAHQMQRHRLSGRAVECLMKLFIRLQQCRNVPRLGNLLGQDVVWINREGRGLGHKGFGAELAVPMATFPTMEAFVSKLMG